MSKNIEEIRRKNLEENQRFLEKLRINKVRNDFVNSARSTNKKDKPKSKPKIQHEKVERVTRYSLKVQSGELQPFIPQWQIRAEKKNEHHPSQWTILYQNAANPYARTFKARIRN